MPYLQNVEPGQVTRRLLCVYVCLFPATFPLIVNKSINERSYVFNKFILEHKLEKMKIRNHN